MIASTSLSLHSRSCEQATVLALELSEAENALQQFTMGQVDAIVDPSGNTYLLRAAQDHLKRLQAVIDCHVDVITVLNRGGWIISQSRAADLIFGYEPEELVGSNFFILVHGDDRGRLHSEVCNVFEGMYESSIVRFRHLLPDGSFRMIDASLGKLHDGADLNLVMGLRPVTDASSWGLQPHANIIPGEGPSPALSGKVHPQRPPSNLIWEHALFDRLPNIIILSADGGVQFRSSPVTQVLGYPPESLVGRNIREFIHPADLTGFMQLLSRTIEKEESVTTAEFRHQRQDGSWLWMKATLGSLRPIEAAGAILIFRDTTELLAEWDDVAMREAACAKACLAKDRFLAMLAHELRTPLSPVLLGIDELLEDDRFTEAQPVLKMIRRNIELQSRLLNELSDFTVVGQQKLKLQMEAVDAHEAVRFVLEICRSELLAAHVEVCLDLRAPENIVRADSVRFQQVMWNLLKNAIKFSPLDGSICISSRNDLAGSLTIEFLDYGIGIHPDVLPLVFEPFEQGHTSIRKYYGGLGLGLFIAKGLMEAQEGTLSAASMGPGSGSTFTLTLPTVSPPQI